MDCPNCDNGHEGKEMVHNDKQNNRRMKEMDIGAGWRLDKVIGAGDLMALAMAVAMVFTSYFTLDKRITVIEATTLITSNQVTTSIADIKSDIKDIATNVNLLSRDAFAEKMKREQPKK